MIEMKNGEKCVDFLWKMTYKTKLMKVSGVVYWANQLKALMTFKNTCSLNIGNSAVPRVKMLLLIKTITNDSYLLERYMPNIGSSVDYCSKAL
jgi:hypothetical protein